MTLGILGGCGPAAGAHFYTRLIALTAAERDSDHVDVLLTGRASTPDRTSALLSGTRSPLASLTRDALLLEQSGADLLVLICHTAHAYLPELRAALHIPVLDMISVTAEEAARIGTRRLGVLCTAGTRRARLYERVAAEHGIAVLYPSQTVQDRLDDLIYRDLKCGRTDNGAAVRAAIAELASRGADAVSLSCTELSLPWAGGGGTHFLRQDPPAAVRAVPILDPIELLALRAITACGKRPKRKEEPYAPVQASFLAYRRSSAEWGMGR